MATEIDRLVITLEANLARYNADMARAQAVTNQKIAAMEQRFAGFSRNVQGSTSAIGVALGSLGAYISASQFCEPIGRVCRRMDPRDAVPRWHGAVIRSDTHKCLAIDGPRQ